MKLPKFLKQGDTIGLVAPSFGANKEPYYSRLKSAIALLENLGFKVKPFGDLFGYYKGASSSAQNRAKAFMDCYKDKDVKAIWSVSGGYMMYEILHLIDFEELKQYPPKFYIGYSDNTNLTFLLPTLLDIISVYGPNLTNLGMKPLDPFLKNTLDLLMGKEITQKASLLYESFDAPDREPLEPYILTEKTKWVNLFNEEKVELTGRAIGGCLDILVSFLGTKYDNVKNFINKYKDDNIIWFLEAAELDLFSYKKALWQLKEAGWFNHSKAILIGRSPSTNDFLDLTLFEVTKEILKDLNIPVIVEMDLGHTNPMITMFTGAKVHLHNSDEKSEIKFLEK